MDKQIKSNQPMTAKQIANLKIIKAKLEKLNRQEKIAGDKGTRIATIIKGFNKPKRGK
jgi:Trp operon repressor